MVTLIFVIFLTCTSANSAPTPGLVTYSVHNESVSRNHLSLPTNLRPCHKSDKYFNDCLKSSLQTFFYSIRNGSKELEMCPIEPLYVPKLVINEGDDDVGIHLLFSDITIFGLGEMVVVSVGSSLENYKFELAIKYPRLDFLGYFSSEGGIKTLPLMANGHFSFNMSDVTATWIIYLKEMEESPDKNYFEISQFLIDVIPVYISAHFGEVIDGDNNLGTTFNSFFNANGQEFFKMAKPKIMDNLGLILGKLANQILRKFPTETLLPP